MATIRKEFINKIRNFVIKDNAIYDLYLENKETMKEQDKDLVLSRIALLRPRLSARLLKDGVI